MWFCFQSIKQSEHKLITFKVALSLPFCFWFPPCLWTCAITYLCLLLCFGRGCSVCSVCGHASEHVCAHMYVCTSDEIVSLLKVQTVICHFFSVPGSKLLMCTEFRIELQPNLFLKKYSFRKHHHGWLFKRLRLSGLSYLFLCLLMLVIRPREAHTLGQLYIQEPPRFVYELTPRHFHSHIDGVMR